MSVATVSLTKHTPLMPQQIRAYPLGDVLLLGQIRPAGMMDGYTTPGEYWSVMMMGTGFVTEIRLTEAYPVRTGLDPFTAMTIGLTAQNDTRKAAQIRVATLVDEMGTFAEQVRQAAIDGYRDDRWCLEGMNGVLSDLGLDTYTPSHEVTVTVRVSATVEAEDEAEARAILRKAVSVDEDDEIIHAEVEW